MHNFMLKVMYASFVPLKCHAMRKFFVSTVNHSELLNTKVSVCADGLLDFFCFKNAYCHNLSPLFFCKYNECFCILLQSYTFYITQVTNLRDFVID